MVNQDMIQISVPARYYEQVITYLGELLSQKSGGEAATEALIVSSEVADDSLFSPDVLTWDRQEILRLKAHTDNASAHAIFHLAWERGGAQVNYEEIMVATGKSVDQVRGDLSGFARTCMSKRFGKRAWPMQAEGIRPTDGSSQNAYQVPMQYLEWWHEA